MNRKFIFDAVRKMMGRGFTNSEIKALDESIDAAMKADNSTNPTADKISTSGVALIKRFEGCARKRPDGLIEAYPDPGTGGDPWTIGWGATGQDIKRGTVWTQAQADEWFDKHIVRYSNAVKEAIGGAPTTQNQFDAMVSFHYNTGAIARATLTKLHRAGDYAGAANEFAKWNKAGGRVMAGLTRRREAEAALYRGEA